MAGSYPSPASIKTPNVGNAASVAIAPQNLTRDSLYIFNPGPNVIWLCPSISNDQSPLAASVGGIGSILLQPLQAVFLDGFTGSVNAIAATGSTNAVTVWENYQQTAISSVQFIAAGGAPVISVFGRTGAVAAQTGDYTYAQISGTPPALVPGQVAGTTTNDNAGAGNIGEFISATLVSGSAISLTNNTPANITNISLTAGDWDVASTTIFGPAATTAVVSSFSSISLASATINGTPGNTSVVSYVGATGTVINNNTTQVTGPCRVSVAAPTTVFAVVQASFTTSAMTAYGTIRARRMR